MRIIISYVCPPIPIREFDYCAFFEGDEESGQYGWGATRLEALIDLVETADFDWEASA